MTRKQLNRRAIFWLYSAMLIGRFATPDWWGLFALVGMAFMVSAAVDNLTTAPSVPRRTPHAHECDGYE